MPCCLFSVAIVLAVALATAANAQVPTPSEASAFHVQVVRLYSFEPHKLTSEQIEAKSRDLDGFWGKVKANRDRFLPLLRAELQNVSNSAFFAYDGSKLLLALSRERSDRALALGAIPRANLESIQHTDYLRTVHWFARNGFNTSNAALRVLDYPDFKAFIVQHALTLGQNYSLIYMLYPLPDSSFVGALVDRLATEQNIVSQKSILLALWYSMTPQARAAAERFIADASRPEEARDYAKKLSERKAPVTSALSLTTVEQLKEERQKVMHRLSDEALHEFDSLTAKLLAKQ